MRPEVKHRLPRGGKHCDFCGRTAVDKLFPCSNFLWDNRNAFSRESGGHWAACYPCGRLIVVGSWAALVSRVMRHVRRRAGIAPEDVRIARVELTRLYALLSRHIDILGALQVHQAHYTRLENLR